MNKRVVHALALAAAAVVLALLPSAGLTWSNGPKGGDGFGTHDWVMQEANDLARAQGVTWVDIDAALLATDDPDTVLRDFYYHAYDVWGSKYGNAPKRVAQNMAAARAALAAGNTQEASRRIGLASHYYADICNPLQTDQSRAENRMRSRYERAVQTYTDSANKNQAWVTSPPLVISDPAAAAKAAAAAAHRDYRTLVAEFNSHGFNSKVLAITKRSMNRAASGIAGLIVSLQDVAPAPSPSPSPSSSPSPSPSSSPSPSPSPSVGVVFVNIENFAYVPSTLTIPVGTVVTWKNDDEVGHTVTSADGISTSAATTGTFDSGLLEKDATFSYTFTQTGTFYYLCVPHRSMASMHGRVVVE